MNKITECQKKKKKKKVNMLCPLFSCKSKYYYNISNFPRSDNEECEPFFEGKNKNKDFHYIIEKAVNEIIYDTKKSCDVHSDFEQVEKIGNKKKELLYSDDCLDDIDIILKKSKTENMFLRKKENNEVSDILLPSKNIKQRIYSINEDKIDIKDNSRKKIENTLNDNIIENFKNVLCNDLNKYFKDLLEDVKKGTEMNEINGSNIQKEEHIPSEKKHQHHFNILKKNTTNCEVPFDNISNCPDTTDITCINSKMLKRVNCKKINCESVTSEENKKFDVAQLFNISESNGRTHFNKQNTVTYKDNASFDIVADLNQDNILLKNTHNNNRRTVNKSRYKKNFYFSKRKKLTKEKSFLLSKKSKLYNKDYHKTDDMRSSMPKKKQPYLCKSHNEIVNSMGNVPSSGKKKTLKTSTQKKKKKKKKNISAPYKMCRNENKKIRTNALLEKFVLHCIIFQVTKKKKNSNYFSLSKL
ncbi:conserved Plasmodium protein, unknown function [Plasmodium malariae]|uniref:Uncharacterized protein n=1 Tax=Plasmodium malariae TaxID=5858 RepID=A0A1C3KYY7_PLAMA|nr:conserved Plasmodium protein, unknown function [Plasmodium malariae]